MASRSVVRSASSASRSDTRDQPVIMAGHHFRRARRLRIGQKLETQPLVPVLRAGRRVQAEFQQRVDQPVFRQFDLPPASPVVGQGEVGDDDVVAAGAAEPVLAVIGHQPVAGVLVRVVAEPQARRRRRLVFRHRPLVFRQRPRRQSRHGTLVRVVAQSPAAGLADSVLEIDQVAAMLAAEQLHRENSVRVARWQGPGPAEVPVLRATGHRSRRFL